MVLSHRYRVTTISFRASELLLLPVFFLPNDLRFIDIVICYKGLNIDKNIISERLPKDRRLYAVTTFVHSIDYARRFSNKIQFIVKNVITDGLIFWTFKHDCY